MIATGPFFQQVPSIGIPTMRKMTPFLCRLAVVVLRTLTLKFILPEVCDDRCGKFQFSVSMGHNVCQR
jgi:hypothetical protein